MSVGIRFSNVSLHWCTGTPAPPTAGATTSSNTTTSNPASTYNASSTSQMQPMWSLRNAGSGAIGQLQSQTSQVQVPPANTALSPQVHPQGGGGYIENKTKPVLLVLGAPLPASNQAISSSNLAFQTNGSSITVPASYMPLLQQQLQALSQSNQHHISLFQGNSTNSSSNQNTCHNLQAMAEKPSEPSKMPVTFDGNRSERSNPTAVQPSKTDVAVGSSKRSIASTSSSDSGSNRAPATSNAQATSISSVSSNSQGSGVASAYAALQQQATSSQQLLQSLAPSPGSQIPLSGSHIQNGATATLAPQPQMSPGALNQQAIMFLQQALVSASNNPTVPVAQSIMQSLNSSQAVAVSHSMPNVNEVSTNSSLNTGAVHGTGTTETPMQNQNTGPASKKSDCSNSTTSSGSSTDSSSQQLNKKPPAVRNTEFSTKIPCRARGMPSDHNYKVSTKSILCKACHD